MIKEVRVDDRLIHGQIALTWPKALQIDHILVANDKASQNKTQQMTLKMAVSSNIKVLIRSIDDAIKLFDNPKAQAMDMMIIVNSVTDAERIAAALPNLVQRVNVANVGRFDGVDKAEKVAVNSQILLSKPEMAAADQLVGLSVSVVHQIIPDDSAKDFKKLFAAVNTQN